MTNTKTILEENEELRQWRKGGGMVTTIDEIIAESERLRQINPAIVASVVEKLGLNAPAPMKEDAPATIAAVEVAPASWQQACDRVEARQGVGLRKFFHLPIVFSRV